MKYLITISLFVSSAAFAGPYTSYSLETSCSPHRNCELQNRFELGYTRDFLDIYIYHESDPRNGFEGTGYVGETENGVGVQLRYEWGE